MVPSLHKHLLRAQHCVSLSRTVTESQAPGEVCPYPSDESSSRQPFFSSCWVSNEPMNGKKREQAMTHSECSVNRACRPCRRCCVDCAPGWLWTEARGWGKGGGGAKGGGGSAQVRKSGCVDGEAEQSDTWWREGDKVGFRRNRAPSVPQAPRWGPGPRSGGPTQPLPSRVFPTGGHRGARSASLEFDERSWGHSGDT